MLGAGSRAMKRERAARAHLQLGRARTLVYVRKARRDREAFGVGNSRGGSAALRRRLGGGDCEEDGEHQGAFGHLSGVLASPASFCACGLTFLLFVAKLFSSSQWSV